MDAFCSGNFTLNLILYNSWDLCIDDILFLARDPDRDHRHNIFCAKVFLLKLIFKSFVFTLINWRLRFLLNFYFSYT